MVSAGQDDAEDETREGRNGWTIAERTTFAVSVLIVVAIASVAIVQHFSRPAGAVAAFEISIADDLVERRQDAFHIPFTIRNVGAVGAREVTARFEVVPAAGGQAVDEVSVTFPVLPVSGSETGMLTITDDPADHVISGRVESYLVP